jgi:hypothetical protein
MGVVQLGCTMVLPPYPRFLLSLMFGTMSGPIEVHRRCTKAMVMPYRRGVNSELRLTLRNCTIPLLSGISSPTPGAHRSASTLRKRPMVGPAGQSEEIGYAYPGRTRPRMNSTTPSLGSGVAETNMGVGRAKGKPLKWISRLA